MALGLFISPGRVAHVMFFGECPSLWQAVVIHTVTFDPRPDCVLAPVWPVVHVFTAEADS